MARIRTIKPEFFTSEDIVSLSPMARLLYVSLWCEADKEGRMIWKPRTFKMRYFPADDCDINAMCEEILNAGLVCLYGDALAYIPSFAKHQHVNPRIHNCTFPAAWNCVQEGSRDRAAVLSRELNTAIEQHWLDLQFVRSPVVTERVVNGHPRIEHFISSRAHVPPNKSVNASQRSRGLQIRGLTRWPRYL